MKRLLALGLALAAWGVLVVLVAGFGGPWVYDLDAVAHYRLHLILAAAAIWALGGPALPAQVVVLVGLVGLWPIWRDLPPGDPGGVAVTVLFANAHSRNTEIAAFEAAMLAADADILAVTELPSGVRETLDRLEAHYPHRLVPVVERESLGMVFYSRRPLATHPVMAEGDGRAVAAALVVGGEPGFSLIVAHLLHPLRGGVQQRQMEALGPLAAPLPGPLVMVGDFNATPWSHAMALAAARSGTELVGGLRFTWRGTLRLGEWRIPELLALPIDHMLTGPGVGVEWIRRVPLPGSDHWGVMARLRLPPPG